MKKKLIYLLSAFTIGILFTNISVVYANTTSQAENRATNLVSEDINSWMPDRNVQQIIMEALNLDNPSKITKEMMSQLQFFEAKDTSFTSFEGLQYANNLTTLSLSGCQVPGQFQLSFFADNTPKLTTLIMSNCGLTEKNLQGYISFYHITDFDFSNNNISGSLSDFTQIVDFNNAEVFNVANNNLSGGLDPSYPDGIPGIVAKDSTIKLDYTWNPQDNFVSAQDLSGQEVTFNNILVTGNVNTKVPGIYEVTYKQNFNNSWGNYSLKKIKVSVVTEPDLKVKDTQIYKGSTWSPKDNFVSATNEYGDKVPFENINVNGSVDTSTPGKYNLTYSYDSLTKSVTVTVEDNKQSITGSDFSMYVGDKTPTASDFKASATDKDGKASEVTVDLSKADLTKAGTYDVTLKSADGQSKVVKLTVKDNPVPNKKLGVYRAYNPNSGEHLYTTSVYEYKDVILKGWKAEGLRWFSPVTGTPVYRAYNPNSGEHFYTMSLYEYNQVTSKGWRKEGIGFYTDPNKGVPIYRNFNPNATGPGSHLYTQSNYEYNYLGKIGWRKEGIAFYGMK